MSADKAVKEHESLSSQMRNELARESVILRDQCKRYSNMRAQVVDVLRTINKLTFQQ